MSQLRNTLNQLESKLQSLVEDNLSRIFAARDQTKDLSEQLLAALRSGIKNQPDGTQLAPNLFTLHVSPSKRELLNQDERLLDELAGSIQDVSEQLKLTFISPPVIRIIADHELSQNIRVTAQFSLADLEQTSAMLQEISADVTPSPANAFLIVNGSDIYTLDKSVINIGRRSDNHLVIDDARVSRVHAQIRLIIGKYVIFDLDSLGGVFVNNHRINQAVLFPGDVISLAGVTIVYGQETPNIGETQRLGSIIEK